MCSCAFFLTKKISNKLLIQGLNYKFFAAMQAELKAIHFEKSIMNKEFKTIGISPAGS